MMNINRREFLNKSTKATVGLSAIGMLTNTTFANSTSAKKKKIALVGTGSRGTDTWGKSLIRSYNDYVEIVGLCDINSKRVEFAKKYIGIDAPTYLAKDFDLMVEQTKPDMVIVTTVDSFHVKYATRAMELGCNVICEKPLAINAKQCQDLLDVESKTGRKVITTFNARHGLPSERIKKVILSGDLGRIISAEFQEYLDINHGASYFRRWHGKSKFSGTLLCHKASHHFDQMNWWLDAEPVEVNAYGKVAYYGKNNSFRSKNCRECQFTDKCKFYMDITKDQSLMDMYVACESEDGYLRDGCVWDNDIDTYDSMTVEVEYNNGVLMSYSLNAFLPYEGQKIAFNGQEGRLDARLFHRQPWEVDYPSDFRLTKNFEETKIWHEKQGTGGHGGADESLKDLIFLPDQKDPLAQMAGSRAGVMASLIGIAAKQSIETRKRVKIADLIDFPNQWRP